MFFMAQVLHKNPIIPDYDITNIEGALFYHIPFPPSLFVFPFLLFDLDTACRFIYEEEPLL